MLDAAAPALALELADAGGDYVQVGGDYAESPLATAASQPPANAAPAVLQVRVTSDVDENGVASVRFSFTDPDQLDQHTIEIDWGDGSPTDVVNLAQGARILVASHQYLDDNPSGTATDDYSVSLRVTDSAGASAETTTTVSVHNIAPSNLQIDPLASIDENGVAQLQLSFGDPGSLDAHTIEVDWGDGSAIEVFNVPLGSRDFAATHQYLDDGLSGTATDEYVINVRVLDDDGGEATSAATVNVKNVAPSNLQIDSLGAINEHGLAQLNLSFNDPGSLDSHTVEIDWGDGSAIEVLNVAAGSRTFNATHQYLDDNPSGTASDAYAVKVRLLDDDLGETSATAEVTVNNVAPANLKIEPIVAINENGVATLKLAFDDPGTLDAHTVEIDWADGSAIETVAVSAGTRNLVATHQYLDDSPSGTTSDSYAINVKVRDDDGGEITGITSVTVNNVAPSAIVIQPMTPIDENGVATLKLAFADPGSLDSHTVHVDWGDGSAVEVVSVAPGSRTFSTSHQYLDDNPSGTASDAYTVKVRVLDDDLGETSATVEVTVNNVAPANLQIDPVAAIDENGVATLNLAFDDPGALDAHTVDIDWGDGSAIETVAVTAGSRAFVATHQYLDDNPSGTASDSYAINVKVRDDDGGEAAGTTSVTVDNVAPSAIVIQPMTPIDENGVAALNLAFTDPGSLDAHRIEVDWGDGSPVELLDVPAGSRSFTATHQYLDDNPTGTPADSYTVTVRVLDDDGGEAAATTSVVVSNVAPLDVAVLPPASATNEGAAITLGVAFADPGSLDTHTWQIDWGDGFVSSGSAAGHSFVAGHTYADNGAYAVTVRVVDDDGGVGTATASVAVANVPPTLAVVGNQTVNEGSLLSLTDIGVFTDPGFNNPLNAGDPANGGETEETFTYSIDWGDGTSIDAGAADIDAAGSVGAPSGGSFDGSHTYADNGVYSVTVRVFDDDGGESTQTFQVTVLNVDPTLAGVESPLIVNEGQAFTLTSLGVGIQDPGFDNPALGTTETFTGVSIDWGDGTSADAFTAANRTSGGPGVPTTADFVHSAHTYADNGTYTVTVMLSDDDGGVVARTLTVVVENVAPTLSLTTDLFVINEGSTLTINNLGGFTDPGYDNPLNPTGATDETFTYTINWGDGTIETGQMPASRTSGSAGVATVGMLADSHFYADNDADNRYTITVTLMDDDGGVDVKSFEITVHNVNPALQPIAATDVNTKGETTLTLSFSDPGADSFDLLVDWGDKLNLPPQDRYVVETAYAGPTPQTFVLTHTYSGPPDPLNPAADIVISVKIRDDDFGVPLVFQPGESNVENVAITNPGIGGAPFRIDTTPNAPPLTLPERPIAPVVLVNAPSAPIVTNTVEIGGSAGEAAASTERFLELRVVNPDGSQGGGFRLRPEVLNNLPELFRNLPDNHYKIFLVQAETNVRRLVIEVFVRNGKLIDPGDDSEGARDRPPTEENSEPAAAMQPTEKPAVDLEARPIPVGEAPASPGLSRLPSSTAIYHRTALAGVALALSGAGRQWHHQFEQSLATASSRQWKRLKTAGHRRPKKPR